MIPDYWAQWSLCVRNAWRWFERYHEDNREWIDRLFWTVISVIIFRLTGYPPSG